MAMESVIQVRIDKELKEAVEKLYGELGTSFSEAVRIFAKKSVDEQAIPFAIRKNNKPKAYGILHKYANPNIRKREKAIIEDSMVKKYVKNN